MTNLANFRLTKTMARKIGRNDLKQKAVGVRYMTADEKRAEGIPQHVIMASAIVWEGDIIAVNVPLGGTVKARRK